MVSPKYFFHSLLCGLVSSLVGSTSGAQGYSAGVGAIRAAIHENDRVENLFPGQTLIRSLKGMDAENLRSGSVAEVPWSSTYWPMNRGLVANRYMDPAFGNTLDWTTNFNYSLLHSVASVVASGDARAIDNLSPAEKYDLIVNDPNGTLARANWERGQAYEKSYGTVQAWMGICDGWSAAAIRTPEPLNPVDVRTASGLQIRFYPSDIKGLASLLWSTGKSSIHLIGTRCVLTSPPADLSGHLLDDDCFNTNPATWHLAVTNEVGRLRKSFVLDSSSNTEIWNQPMSAYAYEYFNPQSMVHTGNLAQAQVARENFTDDRFKAYRSTEMRSVVGVSMNVTFVVEVPPNHYESHQSVVRSVTYLYDLELDGNGNIVGGEWYQRLHPDFLWSIDEGSRAVSAGDDSLPRNSTWDGVGPVPASWVPGAVQASGFAQPLAAIVERLVQRSR